MKKSRGRAQGMTEYVILVGLVAILLIAALRRFSDALASAWNAATTQVESEVTDPVSGTPFAAGPAPPAMGAARMRRGPRGLDPPPTPDEEE